MARWRIFATWLAEVPRRRGRLTEEGFVWVVELVDYRKYPLGSIGQRGSSLKGRVKGISGKNHVLTKVMFTNDDILLGDIPHNLPLYLVGYMRDERVNQILVNEGSSVNILPIHTVKEIGIPMNELSESRVMIQGFNQGGQRAIGAIRLGITIENMQSKSHFADAKFYLKNRIVKELKVDDGMKGKNAEPITKRAEVTIGKAKTVTEEVRPDVNKSHRGDIASYGKKVSPKLQYVPKRKKDEGKSSNIQTNTLKELTLLPSKLGKLPSEAAMRQPREGLGYKQPSPVRISIRRSSSNYITVEYESATSNKFYVFDRLGKSLVKPYTVVYTKERDEDEESVGSSYHVTVQVENGVSSSIEDNAELEDISLYALFELEEEVKTIVDALKEVNLGTDEEPKPTYLSALLEVDEESTYIELLNEFRDVFAWSYKEMPGLDSKVAVHYLAIKKGARPVKQAQRRFRPDLDPFIETEVNKLIEAGFNRKVKYPIWVSSIVPIRKKNGQIRVCVAFRDLNNACPKDEFPLLIPELMINATTGYEAMSFMDGSSGYNQIRMTPKDEELTAFRTPKGIYCYKLVVNQLLGSYEVKKSELRPYHDYAKKLMGWLGDVTIQHVARKENKKADALATLASSLALPDQAQVTVC
ncbi:uncharacterized protein [Nicotiana sylvestris]|uniref:uncharacterized protein n=1 Tax=Nicotiana sylvestris TaxID=4096 RepID=UPI00388CC4AF